MNRLPKGLQLMVRRLLLTPGYSVRMIMAEACVAKQTISTIRKQLLSEIPACPCGEPQDHKGWCAWRFQRSPKRQAFITRIQKCTIPYWQRPAMWTLGAESMHINAIPKYEHCKVRACAYPANGNGQSLCHHHFHFFDRGMQRLNGKLDLADIFSPDGNARPNFHTGFMWQEKANFEYTRFDYKGYRDPGLKISDDYWKKIQQEAMNSVAPKVDANKNIQHTGAFVLWKGFGKKKIRKSQRNRPAGWHGNHPEQKPIKRYGRETIDEIPMMSPASRIIEESVPDFIDEVEIEEQEREQISETLAEKTELWEVFENGVYAD